LVHAQNEEAVKEAYPELLDMDLLHMEQAILFLPQAVSETETTELRFGRLTYDGDFMQIIEQAPEAIGFETYTMEVGKTVTETFGIENEYGVWQNTAPTLLVNEKIIQTSPIIKGYQSFDVSLEKDISKSESQKVDQALRGIAYRYPNAYFSSMKERKEEASRERNIMKTTQALMIFILGSFALVSLYTTIYLSLERRKKMFGIFRGLGMKVKDIFDIVFAELNVYAFLGSAFGILFGFLFLRVNGFFTHDKTLLLIVGIGMCLLFLANLLAAWWLARKIGAQSINSIIREVE
jgi:ABC-type antimicrobial peptide transport system permease subunit